MLKAAKFARRAHEGQRRKFRDRPYVVHPARVAGRAAIHPDATEELVAAAFLHDVVEDTHYTLEDIEKEFGGKVARLVGELTNPSTGVDAPRNIRKQMDREHYAQVSREAKILKLLDRLDNLEEMSRAPAGFLRKYCQESRQLVEVIGDADAELKSELLEGLECLEKGLDPRR